MPENEVMTKPAGLQAKGFAESASGARFHLKYCEECVHVLAHVAPFGQLVAACPAAP